MLPSRHTTGFSPFPIMRSQGFSLLEVLVSLVISPEKCTASSGNSTFTVTKAGTYAWAWRSGYTVLGGNYAYMRVGDWQILSTPVDATSGTKFGVIGGKSYACPSCHS